MKWDDDPNKDLKWNIFDLIRFKIYLENSENVKICDIADAIDEMIDKLTSISNE